MSARYMNISHYFWQIFIKFGAGIMDMVSNHTTKTLNELGMVTIATMALFPDQSCKNPIWKLSQYL